MTISSWLNFGCPAPPRRGSAVGRKFLDPPYYSQRAVFASPLSAFFIINYNLLTWAGTTVNYTRVVQPAAAPLAHTCPTSPWQSPAYACTRKLDPASLSHTSTHVVQCDNATISNFNLSRPYSRTTLGRILGPVRVRNHEITRWFGWDTHTHIKMISSLINLTFCYILWITQSQ